MAAPVRILVLEDNLVLASALARLLGRMGYEVTVVASCVHARAVQGRFALGVFDLDLPDGSGVDVAADLIRAGTMSGVVFYTGTLDGALVRQAEQWGPCVTKTEATLALLEAVRVALAGAARQVVGGESVARVPGRGPHDR